MNTSGLLQSITLQETRSIHDWNVHGIMNTSGLLQSFTLQETRSIHDSMNIPKRSEVFMIP